MRNFLWLSLILALTGCQPAGPGGANPGSVEQGLPLSEAQKAFQDSKALVVVAQKKLLNELKTDDLSAIQAALQRAQLSEDEAKQIFGEHGPALRQLSADFFAAEFATVEQTKELLESIGGADTECGTVDKREFYQPPNQAIVKLIPKPTPIVETRFSRKFPDGSKLPHMLMTFVVLNPTTLRILPPTDQLGKAALDAGIVKP